MREWLSMFLEKEGYSVETASSGKKARKLLKKNPYDIAICDIKMPEVSGMEVLEDARKSSPETDFIMITAYSSTEDAVKALKLGASDYVLKPFELDEFKIILENILEKKTLKKENINLKKELRERFSFEEIIGNSEEIREVISLVKQVANTDSTIHIYGESGTGKELVSKAIHYNSDRDKDPFVSINCGAMPENLLESELFGHLEGSFTGANSDKKGLFEKAHGGTILLDEIGETSPAMQVKLLRVLQDGKIRKVGGTEEIEVNVRIVVSTNKDLEKLVDKGEFREDLFYRINVIPIHIPPLRERKEDISLLAGHFLKNFNEKMDKNIKGISEPAMELLNEYRWPGNVRELENTIERAVALEPSSQILPVRLPEKIRNYRETKQSKAKEYPGLPESGVDIKDYLNEIEKSFVIKALERTQGDRQKAGDLLGLSPRSVRYLINKYEIDF